MEEEFCQASSPETAQLGKTLSLDSKVLAGCVLNAFCLFTTVFGGPPPDVMIGLLDNLRKIIPEWRKDPYYLLFTPFMTRILNWDISHAPHLSMLLLHHLYRFVKGT